MIKETMSTRVETLLSQVGDPGLARILLWLLMLFNVVHVYLIQQFNVLIAYIPPHRCKVQPFNQLNNNVNGSKSEALSVSLTSNSSCSMLANPANLSQGTIPCPDGWEFDTLAGEIYPANEFNLVCDFEYLLHSELSITYTGVMLGGLIFGTITDRFGRKLTMSFVSTLMSACSISMYFVPNFTTFIIIRFILGMFSQGFQMTVLTYNAELFRGKSRTVTSSAYGVLSAILLPFQAGLFYFLGSWRKVHLFMGALSAVSALYSWFLPESIIWLINNRRVAEAERVMMSFARVNKISLDAEKLMEELDQLAEELHVKRAKDRPKWSDLFRSPHMTRIMISLLIICFFEYCILSGLSLSISTLSGNLYINYIINGSIQLLVQALALIFFVKCGRVKIFSTMLFFTGMTGILGYLMKHYSDNLESFQFAMVATFVALLSRNLMAVTVSMMPMFTSELIPTNLRSTGLGFTFVASRLGNVISPQMIYFLGQIWSVLPQIMFGSLALVGSGIVHCLPETINRPLPQNIDDIEQMGQSLVSPTDESGEKSPLLNTKLHKHQRISLEEKLQYAVGIYQQMPIFNNAMTSR